MRTSCFVSPTFNPIFGKWIEITRNLFACFSNESSFGILTPSLYHLWSCKIFTNIIKASPSIINFTSGNCVTQTSWIFLPRTHIFVYSWQILKFLTMGPNQLHKNNQNCSWQRHIIINNMVSFNGRDFKERNEKIRSKQNFELENQRGVDQDHWQFVMSRKKKCKTTISNLVKVVNNLHHNNMM